MIHLQQICLHFDGSQSLDNLQYTILHKIVGGLHRQLVAVQVQVPREVFMLPLLDGLADLSPAGDTLHTVQAEDHLHAALQGGSVAQVLEGVDCAGSDEAPVRFGVGNLRVQEILELRAAAAGSVDLYLFVHVHDVAAEGVKQDDAVGLGCAAEAKALHAADDFRSGLHDLIQPLDKDAQGPAGRVDHNGDQTGIRSKFLLDGSFDGEQVLD
mmetsp:Transcript_146645/g.256096  ORF Transcript_146645/g.256096 Transcript_146645/m.256096 type:complete len:212 (+) Transcript_146645:1750-2385(+)